MSIDVEVFPARMPELTVAEVEKCMRDLSSCRASLGITESDILLKPIGDSKTSIDLEGLYFVPFGCRSLTLNIRDLENMYLEYIPESTRRIPIAELKQLAEQNAKVGIYFNLDSKMGRGRSETSLLLLLAAALAKLTDGLVILPDHPVENIPQGGYWWHEIMERFKAYDGVAIEPMTDYGSRMEPD